MRVAVLSDIHANLPALDAVLTALRPFDSVWLLGDIVGYGPHPDEVISRLDEQGAVGVRGNHDAAALGIIEVDRFNPDAARAIEWTRGKMTARSLEWLARLPAQVAHGDLTLVHGSPRDPTWEYVLSGTSARAALAACPTAHCLHGHTHVPVAFTLRAGRLQIHAVEDAEFPLDDARVMANPGSVGQPRDGDPRASAMLFDTERGTLTWHRVRYEVATTQAAMRAAGLPGRLISRLEYGV